LTGALLLAHLLNSTLVNVGRAIGPIVAATLVSAVGVGWCFIANAASFATRQRLSRNRPGSRRTATATPPGHASRWNGMLVTTIPS
jgi:hypothetical protein